MSADAKAVELSMLGVAAIQEQWHLHSQRECAQCIKYRNDPGTAVSEMYALVCAEGRQLLDAGWLWARDPLDPLHPGYQGSAV